MPSQSIVTAAPAEEARVLSTLAMGFSGDPLTRWVLPEPHQYLTYFPEVLQRMGGEAFKHGSAYRTEDFLGASLWLPPGVHPDQEGVGEVAERALPPDHQEKVFGVLGQMDEYHPKEPHWYLPFIGVDPSMQGAGYGSALLKHALAFADRDKLPAYLEASSPHNRRLYERHGFEAIGEIQAADSPTMWPMLRKPR